MLAFQVLVKFLCTPRGFERFIRCSSFLIFVLLVGGQWPSDCLCTCFCLHVRKTSFLPMLIGDIYIYDTSD